MNTADIVAAVTSASDTLTKAQAKAVVDGVFAAIRDAALKGEEVSIPGFGKFKVQKRAGRAVRHPVTGVQVSIPAGKSLAFQPATALKASATHYRGLRLMPFQGKRSEVAQELRTALVEKAGGR